MKDQTIVCFSKDWNEDPTSNTHVLRGLAKTNKVVWLNSVATRNPNLASARDWGKVFRKLKAVFARAKEVEPNLWVFTPVVAPLPFSSLAHKINRWLLRWMIGRIKRQLSIDEFQLWSFLPTAEPYFGHLGESLSVYYCIDEWSQFTELDTDATVAMEQRICEKSDVVFATAHSLLESRQRYNDNSHLARHGVDYQHFAKAVEFADIRPDPIKELQSPIVGFFGLIHDWVDQSLIRAIAEAHPEWSVVIIGRASVDTTALKGLPNIHLLGRLPYEQLPQYCAHFDVGVIPFKVNELTRHINPIKLREYLSAGIPVVSSPLDEVKFYELGVTVAKDEPRFVAACETAVAENTPERRAAISASMADQTWEAVVEHVSSTVANAIPQSRR